MRQRTTPIAAARRIFRRVTIGCGWFPDSRGRRRKDGGDHMKWSTIVLCLILGTGTGVMAATVGPSDAFFNVTSFGASADGQTNCTQSIRNAIAAASAKGGGTVYFPAGTYLTGPIRLQSHITLYLDAGATVKFSTNFDDYLPMVPSRWEGIRVDNFSPLIYAYKAEDIAIVGRGTLDGQGQAWWDFYRSVSRGSNTTTRTKWQDEF